jgi:hypothetical protein
MVNIDGLLETSTKVITKQIKDISMVKCTGTMGVFTKVSGLMVSSTDMVK